MREIKFRAYIKNNGNGECMEYYDLLKDKMDKFALLHCAIDLNMPIMQYTGLKDKQNKEIYEGDIIAFNSKSVFHFLERRSCGPSGGIWYDKKEGINTNIEGDEKVIYGRKCEIVKWQEDETGFYPFADSPENCGHCGGGYSATEFEVIGNIYENKDLLN